GVGGWLERQRSRRLLQEGIELAHRRRQPGNRAVLGPLADRRPHEKLLITGSRGSRSPTMALLRFPFRAMASDNEIQVDADTPRARRAADAAISDVRRIEAKYSRYLDNSLTTRINRAAGGAPVTIDAETAGLLAYADRCFAQSGGLFDLTSGILRRAWDFRRQP